MLAPRAVCGACGGTAAQRQLALAPVRVTSALGASRGVRHLAPRAPPARAGRAARLCVRAVQPGEPVATTKLPRDAIASWRGYSDRAGELQLTLTYSYSWLTALSSLPYSKVLRALKWVLLAQAAVAVATVAALRWHVARGGAAWSTSEMPHTVVSVALGLLLVHRMTQAYERFWAGRQAWGRLLDLCRNTGRRAVTWCKASAAGGGDADAARALGRDIAAHLLALVAATEARLRCKQTLTFQASLSPLVPAPLLARLTAASHAPLAAADETGRLIDAAHAAGYLTAERALALEDNLEQMMLAAGECDCIARTPTPFEYSTHTSRFLTLFCFSLPLVFVVQLGWYTVPVSLLVTYSLLAIDEISAVVESPFNGYIPLSQQFAALRTDVLSEVLGDAAAAGGGGAGSKGARSGGGDGK